MVVTRALWIFPSALAVDWQEVINYVGKDHGEDACRRLKHVDHTGGAGRYFSVPVAAFNGINNFPLDGDSYDTAERCYEHLNPTGDGCGEKDLEIVAQYMTAASLLSDETKTHLTRKEVIGNTIEELAKMIAVGEANVVVQTALEAEENFKRTNGTFVPMQGKNQIVWNNPNEDPAKYTALQDTTGNAERARFAASKAANVDRQLISARIAEISGDLVGLCEQGLAAYDIDSSIVSAELNECVSSLEKIHSGLSSTVETQSSVFEAPQKPLSGDPKPQGIFGNLEFYKWGEAKFGALLDLQKCVNFLHPAPYPEGDHLLDLVTAKVAHLLPALKLENLPKIRAMLNIGFDLTSEDWDKAVANMSAADKAKPAAQYEWQHAQTFEHFWALYGEWAKKQTDGNVEAAKARIRKFAFPEPKEEKTDVVDQIIS